MRPVKEIASRHCLLYFGFLENHVLTYDRVVLLQLKFLGLRSRIFLGHIEVSGVSGADELDQNCCGLGHGRSPLVKVIETAGNISISPALSSGDRIGSFKQHYCAFEGHCEATSEASKARSNRFL